MKYLILIPLLTLALLYGCTHSDQIEHEGHEFRLPMTLEKAVHLFTLDSAFGKTRYVQFDTAGCKRIQASASTYPAYPELSRNEVWGVSFYYSYTDAVRDSLIRHMEKKYGRQFQKFTVRKGFYYYLIEYGEATSILLHESYPEQYNAIAKFFPYYTCRKKQYVISFCWKMMQKREQLLWRYMLDDGVYSTDWMDIGPIN